MAGPLDGVRVLDLCTVGPGPRATGLLADLGAEVVRVGPPPAANRIVAPDWAYSAARGCRRVAIDLKDDRGRAAFLALVATADVVVEGFRPGVVDRLGIGFEDLRQVNEGIVLASLTGYGQDGPWAQWAGHDVNYQAVGGALDLAGTAADGVPALPGATWADSAGGGMQAALAICAQLVRPRQDRTAVHLDVAATDGVVAATSLFVDEHLATGVEPSRGDSVLTGRWACYGIYACADGRHLAVGAIEPAFWRNLCRLLQLDDLADRQHDDDGQDEVRERLAQRLRTRTRDEWVALLGPQDTCVSPVLAPHEVAANEHLRARGLVAEVALAGETHEQVARVVAGAVRPDVEEGAPVAGSDAEALLVKAGLTSDHVTELVQQGVVR